MGFALDGLNHRQTLRFPPRMALTKAICLSIGGYIDPPPGQGVLVVCCGGFMTLILFLAYLQFVRPGGNGTGFWRFIPADVSGEKQPSLTTRKQREWQWGSGSRTYRMAPWATALGSLLTQQLELTAVGFAPTPLRNGAMSHRLRPLDHTVST